jgi:hypothetical protein
MIRKRDQAAAGLKKRKRNVECWKTKDERRMPFSSSTNHAKRCAYVSGGLPALGLTHVNRRPEARSSIIIVACKLYNTGSKLL